MRPRSDDGAGHEGTHLFTVDVEEYFQVHAFEDLIQPAEWPYLPSRVERSTDRLLELLEARGVVGTFFVVGWVAERHPELVRRISSAGHEVASHSWWHRRVGDQEPEEFREDARRSKALLEDITGRPVLGYRAPSFSLSEDTTWMLEILVEEGYRYDSSLFPSHRVGHGGSPGSIRIPHLVPTPSGSLLELPLTTLKWGGMTLPAAGGAYLRHLPYGLVRAGFRGMEEEGEPGVFYIHPWELDPDQPRIPGSLVARLRHYRNLDRTGRLLERLTGEFDFTSVGRRYRLGTGEGADRSPSVPRSRISRAPERSAGRERLRGHVR